MDLPALWFCLVALMLALYVVFDGFDLGAGILHLFARPDERARIRESLGPYWHGNVVWLLAGGGTLYFAFPQVYARAFSGFYLPLMLVLWLLVFRALGLELAEHVHGVWKSFWSASFGLASLALAVVFGAALGNVIRGVPLDANGRFFAPLWTHFGTEGRVGVLDWYTVLAGAVAALVLSFHGAHWLARDGEGGWGAIALRLHRPVGVAVAVLTAASFWVQPHIVGRLVKQPWGFGIPALAIAAFLASRRLLDAGREGRAFLMSSLMVASLFASAGFGLYPYLLPSNGDPSFGLTAEGAAAPAYGLKIGLLWWIPGMALVTLYFTVVYRQFARQPAQEA
ncbi:MAG: cytochrome d ubiquinol oxidase subunit II [Planctomycetota bacterium]